MTDSLWFITILKEQPWWGVAIGLVFFALLLLIKSLVVYLYSRSQAAAKNAQRAQDGD